MDEDNPLEILITEPTICSICLDDIVSDDMYAIIEGSPEGNIKYHATCIQEWFNHKDNTKSQGIISREPVNSYTIYQHDEIIANIPLQENIQTITKNNQNNCNKLTIIITSIIVLFIIILILKIINIL